MNYLQALGDAFAGKSTSAFNADLQQQLNKDREEMAAEGFTLVIEPLPGMSEDVTPMKDGGQMIRYTGQLVYAFRSPSGQLFEAPATGVRELSREEATEHGSFVFFVDGSGIVVGWSDDLTGNRYGARMPSINMGGGSGAALKVLPWIIVAALLVMGGLYYVSIMASR